MSEPQSNPLIRWLAGFAAAGPLAAQSLPNADTLRLILLPLLAMLGNALGGLLLELSKGSVALWRARVRRSIRAMGEDPDDPKIAALPSSAEKTDGSAKEDKPEGR